MSTKWNSVNVKWLAPNLYHHPVCRNVEFNTYIKVLNAITLVTRDFKRIGYYV
jgi:hypothetical protein